MGFGPFWVEMGLRRCLSPYARFKSYMPTKPMQSLSEAAAAPLETEIRKPRFLELPEAFLPSTRKPKAKTLQTLSPTSPKP